MKSKVRSGNSAPRLKTDGFSCHKAYKTNILLVILVCIPLLLLSWFGWQLNQDEKKQIAQKNNALLQIELQNIAFHMEKFWQTKQQRLLSLIATAEKTEFALRKLVKTQPLINQILLLDQQGKRLHPPSNGVLTHREQDFINRIQQTHLQDAIQTSLIPKENQARQSSKTYGWYLWGWGERSQWFLWWRTPEQYLMLLELNSIRLLSEIIAILPETQTNTKNYRIRLLDNKNQLVYQWGNYEFSESVQPQISLALNKPLSNWHLEYYLASTAGLSHIQQRGQYLLNIGLLSMALVLIGLAIFLYREQQRSLREASQKVNFVNQVSHELKTPLTNIRLYAELLQMHLSDLDDSAGLQRVNVIVSESQRLSRLIANVLTLAKQQKNSLQLNQQPIYIDPLITSVISQFSPSFLQKNIEIQSDLNAPQVVLVDADAFMQILSNLLSNIEKYAPKSKVMINSQQDHKYTLIDVIDNGHGIAKAKYQQVFKPFYRISQRLTEGVAGTGIGLTIARDLAYLHGGDLYLVNTKIGCHFRIMLPLLRQ